MLFLKREKLLALVLVMCFLSITGLSSFNPNPVYSSDIILPTAGSGKALNYDGIDDYIAIPYSTSTRLAGNMDFTISMWFLPPENKAMNLFQQNAYRDQQEAFLRIVEGKINTGWRSNR